jgi:hypothetical protein
LLLVVDTEAASHAGDGRDGTFAWALRVAASFAEGAIERGVDVVLWTSTGRVEAGGGGVERRRRVLLDALALLAEGDVPVCRVVESIPRATRRLPAVVIGTDRSQGGRGGLTSGRAVVLECRGFGGTTDRRGPGPGPAWLTFASPAEVPGRLRRAGLCEVPR